MNETLYVVIGTDNLFPVTGLTHVIFTSFYRDAAEEKAAEAVALYKHVEVYEYRRV
jgi:hypothetical protein